MIHLDVWIRTADGAQLPVGELAFGDSDAQGAFRSEFRYAASWLADARAFALDPRALPLEPGQRIVVARNLFPPLGVFSDALPDQWGRRLLVARERLPRREQSEPHLLRALGGDALGALAFAEPGDVPQNRPSASAHALADLIEAAARFESGTADDGDSGGDDPEDRRLLRQLLAAGSSPGGARPKALVHDVGVEYLAKFPSRGLDDGLDIVALEAVSLELARRAGLNVPDFHLITLTPRRALLVRRFDLTPAGGRRHMVSLQTLCQERPGSYVKDYGTVCETVRKYTSEPTADVAAFFRHVVFNAALGNTDDHLKNFWMLHDESGWRLAPAFDLLPDIGRRREHVLAFGLHPLPPERSTLLQLAQRWAVRQAETIIDEVCAAVAQFESIAAEAAVPAADIARVAPDIGRRVARLR